MSPLPADRRTFGQLLDEWVELRADRWAPKTLDEAKREIENHSAAPSGPMTPTMPATVVGYVELVWTLWKRTSLLSSPRREPLRPQSSSCGHN